MQPETRRLIRSYGLLVLIAIAFTLMAMLVREKPREEPASSLGTPASVAVIAS